MRVAWTTLFATCLFGCAAPVPPASPEAAAPQFLLEGRWTVQSSSLPMWHEADITCPTLVYLPAMTDDHVDDFVLYEDEGEPTVIAGKDWQDPNDRRHVTWRGRGPLFLFSGDWYVRAKTDDWMIIYFESTMVSPEGVDVLARGASLRAGQWAAIEAAIAGDPVLAPFASQLKKVDRETCDDDA